MPMGVNPRTSSEMLSAEMKFVLAPVTSPAVTRAVIRIGKAIISTAAALTTPMTFFVSILMPHVQRLPAKPSTSSTVAMAVNPSGRIIGKLDIAELSAGDIPEPLAWVSLRVFWISGIAIPVKINRSTATITANINGFCMP